MSFDPTWLFLSLFPSGAGFVLFVYGRKQQRWALLGCTVIHRVGRLTAGENIVLVLAASAHRQAALDATAFLIDWLKTRAPFWKREEFTDGRATWVDARETDDAAAARWSVGR